MVDAVRSGTWCRTGGQRVSQFEAAYAKLTGAKRCLATNSGTSAVDFARRLGDRAGRRSASAPLHLHRHGQRGAAELRPAHLRRLRPRDLQIDARKIEAAITDRTAARSCPVHLGGSVADMDTILAIAGKHKLPVVEDACQAHLAEWRGRKVGTLGEHRLLQLPGQQEPQLRRRRRLLTNDEALADKCYAFHNNSRPAGRPAAKSPSNGSRGGNLRMTEFQGAMLMAQMTRLEEQAKTRDQNAQYLTGLLREIPGICPAKMYDGCTRNAYHLYMLRYPKERSPACRARSSWPRSAEGEPQRAATAR